MTEKTHHEVYTFNMQSENYCKITILETLVFFLSPHLAFDISTNLEFLAREHLKWIKGKIHLLYLARRPLLQTKTNFITMLSDT